MGCFPSEFTGRFRVANHDREMAIHHMRISEMTTDGRDANEGVFYPTPTTFSTHIFPHNMQLMHHLRNGGQPGLLMHPLQISCQ